MSDALSAPNRRDAGRVKRKLYSFRLPEALVRKVDKRARAVGVSRTWILETLVLRGLGQDVDVLARTEPDEQQPDLFD